MPVATVGNNIYVETQDPTLIFGTCRNPLIRLAFQEITDHQQGDGMIS